MRILRFILLLFCFGFLLNMHLAEKTEAKSVIVKAAEKQKSAGTYTADPYTKAEAALSRSAQINLFSFKNSRQNPLLNAQILSAVFFAQTRNKNIPEKKYPDQSVRLHLICCVFRC